MPDEENKDTNPETTSEEVVEPTADSEQKTEEVVEEKPAPVEPEKTTQAPATEVPAKEASTNEQETHNTSGILVLQWLTYAFWGWLILAMMWLAGIIFANAILDESSTSSMIPFAMAASIVLLPVAFFTDRFYRKHEPLTKTGSASIIMVIHAVIFALLGIITLIWTVFTSINLVTVIIENDPDASLVSCLVTGLAAILYAAAFVRTLNPFKNRKPLQIYSIGMVAVTILLVILAIAGPFAKAVSTRNDRLIEQNLPSVQSSIRDYVETKNKLPDSLSDLSFNSPETTKSVKDGLVEYKKEKSVTETDTNRRSTEHRYQLCVEYTHASKTNGSYRSSYSQDDDEYKYSASTSSHGAGQQCYKLQATNYNYNYQGSIKDLEELNSIEN